MPLLRTGALADHFLLDIGRSARYDARLAPVPLCIRPVPKFVRHQRKVKRAHLARRRPASVPRPDPLRRLPHDIARPVWVYLDNRPDLALRQQQGR